MQASILGERILVLRRRRGLTQAELANVVKLSPNTVARLERGLIQSVNSNVLGRMATAFETSTDYLLGRTEREGVIGGLGEN